MDKDKYFSIMRDLGHPESEILDRYTAKKQMEAAGIALSPEFWEADFNPALED